MNLLSCWEKGEERIRTRSFEIELEKKNFPSIFANEMKQERHRFFLY